MLPTYVVLCIHLSQHLAGLCKLSSLLWRYNNDCRSLWLPVQCKQWHGS